MCTTAAPALAASTQAAAISAGVIGKDGCLRLNGAFPVTAQVRIIFRSAGFTQISWPSHSCRKALVHKDGRAMHGSGVARREKHGHSRHLVGCRERSSA